MSTLPRVPSYITSSSPSTGPPVGMEFRHSDMVLEPLGDACNKRRPMPIPQMQRIALLEKLNSLAKIARYCKKTEIEQKLRRKSMKEGKLEIKMAKPKQRSIETADNMAQPVVNEAQPSDSKNQTQNRNADEVTQHEQLPAERGRTN